MITHIEKAIRNMRVIEPDSDILSALIQNNKCMKAV